MTTTSIKMTGIIIKMRVGPSVNGVVPGKTTEGTMSWF